MAVDPRILVGDAPLDLLPRAPPSVTTLPQLFAHQARTAPRSIAFSVQTDHGLEQVTYAEAHTTATSYAATIAHVNAASDSDKAPTVAIWLEKGLDLILSILSTTYSGATWLPLDPDVPPERAATCILDASASLIIHDDAHATQVAEVQTRIAPSLAAAGRRRIEARTLAQFREQASTANSPPASGPRPHDAAYLIYTSGTTGTPKGIAIPHSAALAFSLSEQLVLQTGPKDIVWNGFSPAFDMFVEEMWVTIAGGGHLTIGTRNECRDVPGLPALWESRGVTVVNAVPTLIGIMDIAQIAKNSGSLLPQSVRLINLGGEACPPALVSRLARPGLRILNTYGPTETTVTATWDELKPNIAVTIGKPLPGYHCCLLPITEDSSSMDPLVLGEGVEGELAIGGPCVGLGYVGRPDLTAQKFIPHPLRPGTNALLYRTGDRVSLQADGKILFLGRIDTQVKHRGFRIELGEIEARMYDMPLVQAAAVILANANTNTARLEAFVVIRPDQICTGAMIQAAAFAGLPAYMRPEKIHFLEADEMPRLPSGKINAKALQALSDRKGVEKSMSVASTLNASVISSKDDLSVTTDDSEGDEPLGMFLAALAGVFPQAGRIGPRTDLFDDLGLHSLTAAVLVSRLRQLRSEYDKSMPFATIGLVDIYEGRTPSDICSRCVVSKIDVSVSVREVEELGDEIDGTGPRTGEFLPVSQARFIICGIAQIIPLIFLFFTHSLEILVPYLIFFYNTQNTSVGWAILAAYGVFVVIPPVIAVVAIVGKWIILGKAKAGEYPLYGVYYFRWWLAERLAQLVNTKLVADSALYAFFLRALGAKVGKFCHLGSMTIGACCDLIEIGDDVVVGADVALAVSVVERGKLILKKVVIQDGVSVGSNSVVEGGAIICEGAEVGALSLVPSGMTVPSSQRYHGSPARFDRHLKAEKDTFGANRPSRLRATVMSLGNSFIVTLLLPLFYFIPQIPGLVLFDAVSIPDLDGWVQTVTLALPIAILYQILVLGQFILLRRLVLGRLKEGTYRIYSFWYLRKWFVERVMDLALVVLHPVFASLYIVPFLRLLGVKIGHRAEVSTARALQFELLEIGEESFVADAVLMGDSLVRNNELTLKKTTLESRAFAGNASVIPQGTTLPSESLVGVLSIAPPAETPLEKGSSCFGTPPVLMPTRHKATGHQDTLLFNPTRGRVAARLTIEGIRIILPRALIVLGLGFGIQLANEGYETIGAIPTLLMLPAMYFFLFALPALLITALLKWTLIGRYKPAEWPLWSLNVWLSEAVTSTWETITEPLLAVMLVGTPFLAWCFRLMGVRIGSRVTLLASDITEYDCVEIGDETIVNFHCGAQTHLFEDRVMKVGNVKLGKRACLKPYSVCLPGSTLEDGAQLGCLSLLMKRETLPEGTAWEGAPVVPRKVRSV